MQTVDTKLISKDYSGVISMAQAKDHLRILAEDQETLIQSCIDAAVSWAETRTERIFSKSIFQFRIQPEEVTLILPFPDFVKVSKVEAMIPGAPNQELYNETGPVGTLSDYLAIDDWVNPAEVSIVTDNLPADTSYILITAEFGVSKLPKDLMQAMKMMLAHFFDNPNEVVVGSQVHHIPAGAEMILAMNAFKRFG